MKLRNIFCSILLLISFSTSAQTICERNYQKAIVAFEQGKFEQVQSLLESCIDDGQLFKGRRAIYQQLITEASLENQDWDRAIADYLKLLTINPNFKVDPSLVSNEFLQLAKEYQIHPKWTFNIQASAVITNRNFDERFVVEEVEILQEEVTTSDNYLKFNENSSYALGVQYQFTPKLGIGLEASYFTSRLDYVGEYKNATFTDGEKYTLRLAFDEKEQWLIFPVYLKYRLPFKSSNIVRSEKTLDRLFTNLEAYAYVGASVNLLWTAEFEALALLNQEQGKFLTTDRVDLQQKNDPEPSLRNSFNYAILGGLGVRYRIKNTTLFFDVRFSQNQLNQVRENVRYTNNRLRDNYNYVDSDFRDTRTSYTLGFTYSLFPDLSQKK